jgi:hypothetical protein
MDHQDESRWTSCVDNHGNNPNRKENKKKSKGCW